MASSIQHGARVQHTDFIFQHNHAGLRLHTERNQKVSEKLSSKDYGLLSKIFIFLAIDELFQIHEVFIIPGPRPYLQPALGPIWVTPYTALAIYLGLRFSKFLRSLNKHTRQKLLQSAAIFLSGAIGIEMVGSYLVRTGIIQFHSI